VCNAKLFFCFVEAMWFCQPTLRSRLTLLSLIDVIELDKQIQPFRQGTGCKSFWMTSASWAFQLVKAGNMQHLRQGSLGSESNNGQINRFNCVIPDWHGKSDNACIHHKKARFTIAQVLVQSKCEFWMNMMGLHAWINKFLPKHNKDLFLEDELQKLRSWVRQMFQSFPTSPSIHLMPLPATLAWFFRSNSTPKEVVLRLLFVSLHAHLPNEFQRSSIMCFHSFPSFCSFGSNLILQWHTQPCHAGDGGSLFHIECLLKFLSRQCRVTPECSLPQWHWSLSQQCVFPNWQTEDDSSCGVGGRQGWSWRCQAKDRRVIS